MNSITKGIFVGGITLFAVSSLCFYFFGNVLSPLSIGGTALGITTLALASCLWTRHEKGTKSWQKLLLPFAIALIATIGAKCCFLHHLPVISMAMETYALLSLGYAFAKMRQLTSRKDVFLDYILAKLRNDDLTCTQIIQKFPEFSSLLERMDGVLQTEDVQDKEERLVMILIRLDYETGLLRELISTFKEDKIYVHDRLFGTLLERVDKANDQIIANEMRQEFLLGGVDLSDDDEASLLSDHEPLGPPGPPSWQLITSPPLVDNDAVDS